MSNIGAFIYVGEVSGTQSFRYNIHVGSHYSSADYVQICGAIYFTEVLIQRETTISFW